MRFFRLGLAQAFAAIGFLATLCSTARGEDVVAPPVVPEFSVVTWLPQALPVLQKASIATEGIAIAPAETAMRKGDSVTALIQAANGKVVRQWAVVLKVNGIKPEEQKLRSPGFSMYLSTGRKVDFEPAPFEGVAIHVVGPFVEDKTEPARAKDIWSGSLVNPQFLRLGLERTPALMLRIREAATAESLVEGRPISLDVSTRPYAAEKVAAYHEFFERVAITDSEARSYAGFIPAMLNFFLIANQTPGVREIISEAIDVPWLSIIAHGGKITDTSFNLLPPLESLAPAEWGLPADAQVYAIGFQLCLQGKPALNCRLAVTEPRVPLANSAGIVGLSAMRPDGKGPRVMLRIMAGSPAGASSEAADR